MQWILHFFLFFFFSSRRRHTRSLCDWSSDVCSSDLSSGIDPFFVLMSGHLTRTKNGSIPDESLVDIHLTKSGLALVQGALDRIFCEQAIILARESIAENDGKPHPYVGVVIVKDGNTLATGYRGESGVGDHG